EHFAQGRLTAEEHGERLDQVWAARTRGELTPIFSDLPGHTTPAYGAPRAGRVPGRERRGRRGIPVPVLVVLAILVVVTVASHLPIILIGLLVWFLLASRHGHLLASRHGHHGYSRRC
ncbi:MAG TPA: DUF1707 domain-containing protein, partial [Nocardioides sp.]|nr:DUF1707 domain-containing protein [Nocardioides sp.]